MFAFNSIDSGLKKKQKKKQRRYTHCSSHSFIPPAPVDMTFPDSSCPLTCCLPAEWVESLWPHRSSIPTIPLFRLSDQSHYSLCNWILMPPLHCFLHWWTADVTSLRLPPLRLLFGRMKEHFGWEGRGCWDHCHFRHFSFSHRKCVTTNTGEINGRVQILRE